MDSLRPIGIGGASRHERDKLHERMQRRRASANSAIAARSRQPRAGSSMSARPRQARPALAAAGLGVAVGDRAVPARHRAPRTPTLFAQGYDTLLILNGVLVGAADAGRRLAALATAPQSEGAACSARGWRCGWCCCSRWWRCCRARSCTRCRCSSSGAASRAGSTCASIARSKAASALGPQRARLPAQGHGQQGDADGDDAWPRVPGNLAGALEPRGGAG